MKRLRKVFAALAVCMCFMLVPATVKAASILSLNASSSGSSISVSGTAETAVLACAISVYDSSSNLVAMESCGVNSDSTFSYTMTTSFANGDYTVKVADYNGGPYAVKAVTVGAGGSSGGGDAGGTDPASSQTPQGGTRKSPKTGGGWSIEYILGVLGAMLLGTCMISLSVKSRKNA